MTNNFLYTLFERVFGRRFLWRLGRFFYLSARRELSNAMGEDGEFALQKWVVSGLGNAGRAPVLFDVGANLGLWTIAMARLLENSGVEKARIFAFEPAPDQRVALKDAIARTNYRAVMTVMETALGHKAAKASFEVTGPRTGTSHLVTTLPKGDHKNGTIIEVEVISVDEFLHEENIQHVDFMKIDTEGNDFNVILGAETAIENGTIDVIQFEYGSHWIDFGHSLKAVIGFAHAHKYRFGRLTTLGIELHEEWHPEYPS